MHADAAAARRLRLERLRHVLRQRRGIDRRDVAVGLLHVEARRPSGRRCRRRRSRRLSVTFLIASRIGPWRLVEERQRVEQARRRARCSMSSAIVVEQRVRASRAARTPRCASIPLRPRSIQLGRRRGAEGGRAVAGPVVVERRAERLRPASAPRRTMALFDCTKNPRQLKFVEPHTTACTFGPSTTMVLLCCSLPHVLALHVGPRRPTPRGVLAACVLARTAGSPWSARVVDDDPERACPSFSSRDDDLGLVEVVGDDAHLRLLVGDGLVEHLEDRVARLEAHPRQRLGGLRVGRDERQTLDGVRRQQRGDRPVGSVAIDERLRRDEAAGEGDVELARDRSRAAARSAPPGPRRSSARPRRS